MREKYISNIRKFTYKPSLYMIIAIKLLTSAMMIGVGYKWLEQRKIYLDAHVIYRIYTEVCNHFFCGHYTDSYYNLCRLYSILTLGHAVSYQVLFIIAGILWGIAYVFMVKSIRFTNTWMFLIVTVLFVFDAVYMLQPAKDTVVLLANTLILRQLLTKKNIKFFWISFIFLLEGVLLKPYILILLIFYGLVHLVEYNKKAGLISFSVGFLAFILLQQFMHFQFLINARIIGNANTTINELFPKEQMYNNVGLFLVNYLVSLIRMLFPFELLIKAPTRAIFFIPMQLGILYIWFKLIRYLILKFKNKQFNDSDGIIKECLYILIIYTLVSALFEPDFGSILRHQCGYAPFYIYLLFQAKLEGCKMIPDRSLHEKT